MEHIDLLTLQSELKEELQGLFPGGVWVKAEIAQMQVRGGHCYMDLVQSEKGVQLAKARAIVWNWKWNFISAYYRQATGSPLAAGQQVLLQVKVNYSELYGLSLVVDDINPEFTLGDAELKKQQTIEELVKLGLMDQQKELCLPDLPYRLAVISAKDAAGYGDFCRHLLENEEGYVFKLELFDAVMQGANCPPSVVDALQRVESSEEPWDAVLILRGGGAELDLAWFNDFELCCAIANCRIPVFTAIGHDRDFHVADMVAHKFLKTPTALADEFLALYRAEDERLQRFHKSLSLAFSYKISQLSVKLENLASRIASANPRAVLGRGYTLTLSEDGVVLHSADSLAEGDRIRILMQDGEISATIDHISNAR